MQTPLNFFWFRRDLRLEDNTGLYYSLNAGKPVQALFIFDTDILDKLEDKNDRRIVFIHRQLDKLNNELKKTGATLLVKHGKPVNIWRELSTEYAIENVFTNHDYESYALARDQSVNELLKEKNIGFHTFKDQVIFEKDEIVKDDGTPYTVFTPYMKKWRKAFAGSKVAKYPSEKLTSVFNKKKYLPIIKIDELGFKEMKIEIPSTEIKTTLLKNYEKFRDFPAAEGTSKISVHLRFGTISIRQLINSAWDISEKWVNELIWREFYMMILWHFPHVTEKSFKKDYDLLRWRNNEEEFQRWCEGKTGYPIVDAGMRELNKTGFMHNRLRMITAMFLTKYLLVDWRWGEAYFASKLIDYELSSNNGGWQWSAGTGVDAAPYFRIFSMAEQTKRFDPQFSYIKKWVPEFQEISYPSPVVDYNFARKRCLEFYKNMNG